MIDRFEIIASRIRHLVSRNRWSARLLGYPAPFGEGDEAGLVLVQVDGLGEDVLRRVLREGRMPFLRHLIEDERYDLQGLYTGMPSSTPGFQAEFFFGVKTAVPAFGYRDRALDRVLSLNDPTAASAIEKRLIEQGRGLLHGGSAWSNIFSGDASEPHLCASTAGLDLLLKALDPTRLIGLLLWHSWSALRVIANLFAETGVAIYDFFRGTLQGRSFIEELRFIPTRVVVSAVMREIVTAGASIDAERGLPIIQLNLLGYDEHAHRRGPDSRFARWTLKGIDNSIRRVWLAAHRSKRRDYQVWVYSDHGQEETAPYPLRYGESVAQAIQRVHQDFQEKVARLHEQEIRQRLVPASGTERSDWLRMDLPEWLGRVDADEIRAAERAKPPAPGGNGDGDTDAPPTEPPGIEIVHQGPVGFVYLERPLPDSERDEFAATVAGEARIPTVMTAAPEGQARVFRHDGTRMLLPRDAAAVFGADHPYLDEVTEDVLRTVHHEDAGDLVLMGWDPKQPFSLQLENGAHGGPGPRETSAFVVLPPEHAWPSDSTLRPQRLREMAQEVLSGRVAGDHVARVRASAGRCPEEVQRLTGTVCLRVLSYNVHGCRGMDGKFSPQRIARVLGRIQPDIICLQELDQSRSRSGSIDQVDAIAESLQADYHFHAVAEVDDGQFGNAILSPHPLRRIKAAALPALRSIPGLEDRGVLWVEVDIGETTVQVINTHLSILEQERRLQIDTLVGNGWLGQAIPRGPLILCGDLNAPPESYTCRQLGANLRPAALPGDGRAAMNTWSSRIPVRRIDHIYFSEDVQLRAVEVPRTRLTRVASDHLPLVADLSCRVAAPTGSAVG